MRPIFDFKIQVLLKKTLKRVQKHKNWVKMVFFSLNFTYKNLKKGSKSMKIGRKWFFSLNFTCKNFKKGGAKHENWVKIVFSV